MKKCYFSNFFKSFSFWQFALLSIAFLGVAVVTDNINLIFRNEGYIETSTKVLTFALYGVSAVASLCGIFKIKANKMNIFDFNRVTTLVGVGSAFAYKAVASTMTTIDWVLFPVCLGILLILNLIRIFAVKPEAIKNPWKHYTGSIARGINLFLVVIIGVGLAYTVLHLDLVATIIDSKYYWYGIIGAIALPVILIPIFRKRGNFIDALVLGVAFAFAILFVYCKRRAFLLPAFAITAIMIARGSLIKVTELKEPKSTLNKYYSQVLSKYDIIFPALIAVVVAKLLYLVAFDTISLEQYLVQYKLDAVPNIDLIVLGVAALFGALPVVASLFLSKKGENKVVKVDYALLFSMLIAVFLIPAVIMAGLDFNALLSNNIGLGVAIFACVTILILLVCVPVRLIKFAPEAVAEEAVEEPVAEEAVAEEPVAEEPVAEEVAEEPVAEEVAEEPVAEEVAEEAVAEEAVEEPVVEEVAEEPVAEEVAEEPVVEEAVAEEVAEEPVEEPEAAPKRIRRKFKTRMMLASDSVKNYYSEVKNYLESYRAKGRLSSTCETFRRKGLLAKVILAGKSVKVYLALDPQELQGSKYYFQDASAKKKFAQVPVCIKVRSKRGLNHFKELTDLLMAKHGHKVNKKYQPVDYAQQLVANGEVILAELGFDSDYIYDTMHVRNIPAALPSDLSEYIPTKEGKEIKEELEVATIYLDTLCNYFNEGEVVNLETLKENKLVSRGNVLRVRARGAIDRKLTIYAEEFDEDALKMILCTNGTAVKVINK